MPADSGFLETMDLFYKVHKVFDLEYHPSLNRVMHFVEMYLYGRDEKYIVNTPLMKSFAKELGF